MLKKESLRKADVIFSIILICLSIYILIESLRMPVTGLKGTVEEEFYIAPGFLPTIVTVILMIMGLFLLINGLKSGGKISKKDIINIIQVIKSENFVKSVIMVALIIIYTFILIGRLPFFWATFIFLTISMLFLRATSWWRIILISAVASLVITYSFGTLARIPLP